MVELLGVLVSLAAVAVLVLGAVVAIAIGTLVWLGAMAASTGRESRGRVTRVPADPRTDGRAVSRAAEPRKTGAPAPKPVNGHANGTGVNGLAGRSRRGSAGLSGDVNGRPPGRGADRQVRSVAASVPRV